MTLKYKEYMDKIEISEEMKSRILSNIEEFEKKSNSNNKSDKIVRPFFKKKVYKGLALVACFALVISSTLLYKNINGSIVENKDTHVSERFLNNIESKIDEGKYKKPTSQRNNKTGKKIKYKNKDNDNIKRKVIKQTNKKNTDNTELSNPQTYNKIEKPEPVIFKKKEINSLAELSERSGFTVKDIIRFPFKINNISYKYINKIAVIKYSGDENHIVFKMSKRKKDNSSTDLQNENTVEINLSGRKYLLKKDNELYNGALWKDEKYSYSITLKKGIDLNSMENFLKNIK